MSCRLTAAEALETIREYHEGFARAQLKGRVLKPVIDTLTLEERMQRAREANARQEAREKES
ncbi:hypothetical protein PILCRDRAFT_824110 [Piloderma croceum F 1598]|uniref:Uncharacterized protein n=1 Tax=Piloderma croceum (strain F 1598) TaxID=765440 RepID=A0A0C3FFB8_PILCF|nr:hypothetical protein PILCRDRAFT_824110 [Piloderma croceum F 1598]